MLSGSTTYSECADYKGKKWCATSLLADGSYKDYGYCNVAKCGGERHENKLRSSDFHFISGAGTTKGCVTDTGEDCVFPFKDGKVYTVEGNLPNFCFQALPLTPSVQTTEEPSGAPSHYGLTEPTTSGATAKWTLANLRVGRGHFNIFPYIFSFWKHLPHHGRGSVCLSLQGR